MFRLAALGSAVLVAGCVHGPPKFDLAARPTCLVLSVGGATGVAHLGAIEAVRASHAKVDCVVGTSMGSLVGALYASDPAADTTARFVDLVHRYEARSAAQAAENAAGGALVLGLVAGVLSGGSLAPVLAAASSGAALGAATTRKLDHDRLVEVLDDDLAHAKIESLPLPYATLYETRDRDGFVVVDAREGDVADAVGKSIANPMIFSNLDVTKLSAVDPGADRLAAVPVEDACRMFPGHNLLAINTSGVPAVYSTNLPCPVRVVDVPIAQVKPAQVFALGREFDDAVAAGREVTAAALR